MAAPEATCEIPVAVCLPLIAKLKNKLCDDNFLRMKASIASSRGRPPKLQQQTLTNKLLLQFELLRTECQKSWDEVLNFAEKIVNFNQPSLQGLNLKTEIEAVAKEGSIHELKDSNTATINFMKKCVLSNNTYVWPQPRLYDDISWCYIFEADFQIDTRNGRIWNVPIDTNLDLKYQMYKKKYCV